ncbi:MAG: hypothetical protein QXK65_01515, partial [Candidatus Micrarchaeaceae archaeon]
IERNPKYFRSPPSPGEEMLLNEIRTIISKDSEIIGKVMPSNGVLVAKAEKRALKRIFEGAYSGDCTAPPNTGDYSGINFWANLSWVVDPGTRILNLYKADKVGGRLEPVGRAYLFAVTIDNKPAVLVDSIEFLRSFNAGIGTMKAVVEMLRDYAKWVGTDLYIDKRDISNSEWVNKAIDNAGFKEERINSLIKLGNRVYADHLEATTLRKIS